MPVWPPAALRPQQHLAAHCSWRTKQVCEHMLLHKHVMDS